MRTLLQGVVVVSALSVALGCGRKAVGEYEPEGFDGPNLPWSPDVVEAGATTGQVGPDEDEDGVSDEQEELLGLDPANPDTDGDGFLDGEELAANSDAADATHFPYTGGWAIDPCREDIVATGDGIGQITADFALTDQHNETVRLHDFCGKEVLLVTSAMWCVPCQQEAPELQHWYETYTAQGFIVITLLGEDANETDPLVSDLKEWSSTYGIKHPVLADPGYAVSSRFFSDPYSFAIPTMHLLGAGAEVLYAETYVSEPEIEANLP